MKSTVLKEFLERHGSGYAISLAALSPTLVRMSEQYQRHIEVLKTEEPELYEYLIEREAEYYHEQVKYKLHQISKKALRKLKHPAYKTKRKIKQ